MNAGSASIKSEVAPWSKPRGADAYLLAASVGVMAGLLVTYARTPLHLPGHKALFWMIPVLTTRLLTRRRAAASVGALATVASTLLLGGRLAGGAAATPLVLLAGLTLDLAARAAERTPATRWRTLLLLTTGGAAANLLCFAKRLFEPTGAFFSTTNLQDLTQAAAFHAFFGLIAGLAAATLHIAIRRARAYPHQQSS